MHALKLHKSKFKILCYILMFINLSKNQELQIKNLHNNPISISIIRNCKVQEGLTKIIHPIDLNNIETTINKLSIFISFFTKDQLGFKEIIKVKFSKLRDNFIKIKPNLRNRQKRWDLLGTTWKWLAGNPDAEDLRIINSTMDEIIEQNNEQFKINNKINKRFEQLVKTVNELTNKSNNETAMNLTEFEMIRTIINIDIVNKILEDIQDAITGSKITLPNNKLLSAKEIIIIESLLLEDGVNIEIPDDALKYVTPKIVINNYTLLYIIEVPKLEKTMSAVIQITPLVINNTILEKYPNYLIKSNQKLFTTSNPNNYVQRYSHITEFNDDCIKPLIIGRKSKCHVIPHPNSTIHLIEENKLILNNANNTPIDSNCGPDKQNLTGNFIITFYNCTVKILNLKLSSYEIKSNTQELERIFQDLQLITNSSKSPEIELIEEEMVHNRKKLEHIYLKQFEHQNWIRSLGGVSTTLIICIIVIWLLYIKTRNRTNKIDPEVPTTNLHRLFPTLLKPVVTKKDEDVHSSPPGGVTNPTS